MTWRVARGVAMVIALAGVIDPAVSSRRATRPDVAVVTADSIDGPVASDVARELAGRFNVVRAPYAGAAATVIVGSRLPDAAGELASPVFAVFPARAGRTVAIERVTAPARAALDSRVPVRVATRAKGGRGDTLDVSLRMGGVVVDRVRRVLTGDDDRGIVALEFAPGATGGVVGQVTARVGTGPAAEADFAVDVRRENWPVLFFDARPSWMSTFVRRAVEADPRFTVTSRVVTSRGVSTDQGRPPALDDAAALSTYDAVVVGAPEALSDADVAGLANFLRRRGGSVVFLFDRRADGAYTRIADVGRWLTAGGGEPVSVAPLGPDTAKLAAGELMWPAQLPAGAEALAQAASGSGAPARPVIWRVPVGAGRLVMSGALDAWRYRDPSRSAFDPFWRALIAEAAAAAPPAIEASVANALLAPGERTDVIVRLRGAVLAVAARDTQVRASVGATLAAWDGSGRRDTVRLWPDDMTGTLRGSLRAPRAPGSYRVTVTSGDLTSDALVVVATTTVRPAPDDGDLVTAWAGAHGGAAVPFAQRSSVAAAIERALGPSERADIWHPMRSAWWIAAFALALGIDWIAGRRARLLLDATSSHP